VDLTENALSDIRAKEKLTLHEIEACDIETSSLVARRAELKAQAAVLKGDLKHREKELVDFDHKIFIAEAFVHARSEQSHAMAIDNIQTEKEMDINKQAISDITSSITDIRDRLDRIDCEVIAL
jgi:chorismate mutase